MGINVKGLTKVQIDNIHSLSLIHMMEWKSYWGYSLEETCFQQLLAPASSWKALHALRMCKLTELQQELQKRA